MVVVFTPKFEDLAKCAAALSGLTLNGRKITMENLSENLPDLKRYYEQIGYMNIKCPSLDQRSECVFIWGENILKRVKIVSPSGKIKYVSKVSNDIQSENVVSLLSSRAVTNLYFAVNKEALIYCKNVLDAINIGTLPFFIADMGDFSKEEITKGFSKCLNTEDSKEHLECKIYCQKAIEKADSYIETALSDVYEESYLYPGIETLPVLSYLHEREKESYKKEEKQEPISEKALTEHFIDSLPERNTLSYLQKLKELGFTDNISGFWRCTDKTSPLLRILSQCTGCTDGLFIKRVRDNVQAIIDAGEEEKEYLKKAIRSDLNVLLDSWTKTIKAQNSIKTAIPCPVCKNRLCKSTKEYFCEDCGFFAKRKYNEKLMTDKEMKYLFSNGSTPLLPGFFGDYLAKLVLDEDKNVIISESSDYSCPLCREKLLVRNKERVYVCKTKDCCFTLPRTYKGHSFTKDEIHLLLTGNTLPGIQLYLQDGSIIIATIFLNKESYYELAYTCDEKE